MFFLFGTGIKSKYMGRFLNIPCAFCDTGHTMRLTKYYDYFHIFFIPLFHFNTTYYLSCPECNAVFRLDKDKAQRLYRDPLTVIESAI